MRKAIRASVLVLLLTCSAQAGYIQNGSPAPSDPVREQEADGEMQNGLTGALLSVLESVLALF